MNKYSDRMGQAIYDSMDLDSDEQAKAALLAVRDIDKELLSRALNASIRQGPPGSVDINPGKLWQFIIDEITKD